MTAACCASLGDGELRDLVVVLAELAAGSAGPSPDRPWAPSISNALGWFARRRLKRALASHSPGEIAGIDFSAWRTTLRRMARAQALDATEGDLAAALVAVVSDRKELKGHRPDPGSDLTLLVADCPAGCDLMRDVTLSWARSLSHTGRKGDLLGIE